jgi:hypothetical protein
MISLAEPAKPVSPRHAIVLLDVVTWFSQRPEAVAVLCGILAPPRAGSPAGTVSLRSIDHFVTRVCASSPDLHAIHDDYRRHLSAFSKRLFDPFARRERISVVCGTTTLYTTIGQLRFMRWLIESGAYALMTREGASSSFCDGKAAAGFADR